MLAVLDQLEGLMKLLGTKAKIKYLVMNDQLKGVHEALRMQINNYKMTFVRSKLREYLLDIQPRTEEQRRRLPELSIQLNKDKNVKFYFEVRKGREIY